MILPLTRGNENYNAINVFAFLNFFFQLFSLYQQKNFIIHHFLLIIKLIFRIKNKRCCLISKNINEKISLLAGATNEIVIAIILTVLNIAIFGKTVRYPLFDLGENKKDTFCKKSLEKDVFIGVENLCFIFAINFFFFAYLILKMKDKQKSKFLWKMENYSILVKIFYLVEIYALIDFNFQFYLELYLINK